MERVTYENLIMYSCATPCYDDVARDWDDTLDANDPDNFDVANTSEIFIR